MYRSAQLCARLQHSVDGSMLSAFYLSINLLRWTVHVEISYMDNWYWT